MNRSRHNGQFHEQRGNAISMVLQPSLHYEVLSYRSHYKVHKSPPNSMPQSADEEEGQLRITYRPIYNPLHPRPVEVSE